MLEHAALAVAGEHRRQAERGRDGATEAFEGELAVEAFGDCAGAFEIAIGAFHLAGGGCGTTGPIGALGHHLERAAAPRIAVEQRDRIGRAAEVDQRDFAAEPGEVGIVVANPQWLERDLGAGGEQVVDLAGDVIGGLILAVGSGAAGQSGGEFEKGFGVGGASGEAVLAGHEIAGAGFIAGVAQVAGAVEEQATVARDLCGYGAVEGLGVGRARLKGEARGEGGFADWAGVIEHPRGVGGLAGDQEGVDPLVIVGKAQLAGEASHQAGFVIGAKVGR